MTAPLLQPEDFPPDTDEATRAEAEAWAQKMVKQGLTWDQLSVMFNKVMLAKGEWAGIPIPIDGLHLTIEDRYPYKNLEFFNQDEVNEEEREPVPNEDRVFPRYSFYSRARQLKVGVFTRFRDGKVAAIKIPIPRERVALQLRLNNLTASWAWSMDAEITAQEALCELIGRDRFRYYFFTGMFLESSARSGITYIFRRSRPTLAVGNARNEREAWLVSDSETKTPRRIIAALCLHPIAYYQQSFAGAMTPTDDVLAHLLLMRGDEKLFWRRANQHPFYVPESGL